MNCSVGVFFLLSRFTNKLPISNLHEVNQFVERYILIENTLFLNHSCLLYSDKTVINTITVERDISAYQKMWDDITEDKSPFALRNCNLHIYICILFDHFWPLLFLFEFFRRLRLTTNKLDRLDVYVREIEGVVTARGSRTWVGFNWTF